MSMLHKLKPAAVTFLKILAAHVHAQNEIFTSPLRE